MHVKNKPDGEYTAKFDTYCTVKNGVLCVVNAKLLLRATVAEVLPPHSKVHVFQTPLSV